MSRDSPALCLQTSTGQSLQASVYPFAVCSDKPVTEALAAAEDRLKQAAKELSTTSGARIAARTKAQQLVGELNHKSRGTCERRLLLAGLVGTLIVC